MVQCCGWFVFSTQYSLHGLISMYIKYTLFRCPGNADTPRRGVSPDHPAAFTRRERCRAKDNTKTFSFLVD